MSKRRQITLAAIVIAVAYAVGLALWAGAPVGGGNQPPAAAGPASTSAPATVPAQTPPASPSPSPKRVGAGSGDLLSQIKNFPQSLDARDGGLPKRGVRIVITSDAVIAGLAYKVAHGTPETYSARWRASPVVIQTTGRSGGLVAAVLAEAGPTGSYVTCAIYVDGVLRSKHTKYGRYQFAACLG